MKIKVWISAFRLRTIPLAIACIGMGGIVSYEQADNFVLVTSLTILTAIFLQVLSNLSNDYGDTIHGADNSQRKGPSRAVQDGSISKKTMFNAIILFVILSLFTGTLLVLVAFPGTWLQVLLLIAIGVAAVMAAVFYTMGKNPYGYAGFGDLFVFIFFGLVAVLGTAYLNTRIIDISYWIPAISCGLLSVAVLNVNNIRDIESDRMAGKKSIPVRIGRRNAIAYHWILLLTPVVLSVYNVLINKLAYTEYLFLLIIPFILMHGMKVYKTKDSTLLNGQLKVLVLISLFYVVLIGLGRFI